MAYSAQAISAVKQGLALAIPHEMKTSEWAAERRFVDRGAFKGLWSNDKAPFMVEIMDAADDPRVREIVFQKPAQIGGSEFLNNVIGKRIDLAPTDIIYCAEKEDKATAWTQESFDTMVRATPTLKSKVAKEPEFNNQKYKKFAGGGLYIVWATSPAELSSRPAEILIFDEKAAYKPTKEGDPVKLGEARQKTYDDTRLTIKNSTPRRCLCTTDAETCGDISHDFLAGDQREYYVPCPHCDEFQTLKFGGKDTNYGLKWDAEAPEAPYYVCEHCACMIEEFDRDEMLIAGKWIAAKPFVDTASFKINQLYSPFVSWATFVADWLDACKDKAKLEVFTNTVLGEVWKPIATISYDDLAWNLEQYAADVPPGVLLLTAGVDIQKDRIECEIVGWGHGNESWSIDYRVLFGDTGVEWKDPATDDYEPSVWNDLEQYLASSFIGTGGQAFRVQCACVDSGYQTDIVYRFVHKFARRRWFAIKGMPDPFKPAVSKPTMQGTKPRVRMFPLGVNAIKDEVFSSLRITKHGPSYCHFPDKPHYDEAHMRQLCSEKMTTHTRQGRSYRVYEKLGPNVRNEALDVRVYAIAARAIFNPRYDLLAKRNFAHSEAADAEPTVNESLTVEPDQPPPPPPNVVPFRGGSLTKNNPFAGYRP